MREFLKGLALFCAVSLQAAEFYVARDGSDENSGTLEQPLATLQAAAGKLQPGDTCFVRGGTYFQPLEINGLKGTTEAPILFRAYGDETVVLDGTADIEAEWMEWKDGIRKAVIEQDIWQLFSGDKLLDLARWPNASVNDGSIWEVKRSMRSTDREWNSGLKRFDGVTQSGVILDRNHKEALEGVNVQTLAEIGLNFSGAVAVLNIGHWRTWARPVLEHEAGSNRFSYDPAGTEMLKFLEYCIYGLPALDRENEWWFDAKTKTLYFKPLAGAMPSLRGKVRDFNLVARDCEYVRFQGLNFFATTFMFDECSNMLLEDSRLLYPSTHKFVLGELDWFGTRPPKPGGNAMTLIYNSGEGDFGNEVRNCSIEYPNSPAIGMFSPGSVLENCCIHDVEWDVNSSGGSGALPGGSRTTIRNCTLHTTGASEGIRLGAASTIDGNRLYNTSLLQHDGSAINMGTPHQRGTVARRNWIYNTNRQAMRFDSTTKSFGREASVVENVFFDVDGGLGGNKFKGDYQLVANNTAFDCFVAIPKGYGDTEVHNANSLVANNLADHLVEWNMSDRVDGIPARMVGNVSGEGVVRRLLRDPDNFDFRPKDDAVELIEQGTPLLRSELVGADIRLPEMEVVGGRPDIGAYEYGASSYWIPGCALPEASSPVPPDGALKVKADADLMWLNGRNAASHAVYLAPAESEDLPRIGTLDGTSNIFDPGVLVPGKSYRWRVDAVEADGTVRTGADWTFEVEQAREIVRK